jgi:hypothetical protein
MARLNRHRCALSALAVLTACGTAAATPDRDNTTKTGWWWLNNATHDDIQAKINDGYRPVELEPLVGTNPPRFTCAFVSDSGSFAKGYAWNTISSPALLNSVLTNGNYRLIDLEPYERDGEITYAYIAVENVGDDFASSNWWIADRTEQQVRDFAVNNNARPLDVDVYWDNGQKRYAAVLVPNSGAWERDWTWAPDSSTAVVGALLLSGKRVAQIERENLGTYNVLIEDMPSSVNHHWWFYGWSNDQINNFTEQYGTRLISVDRYVDGNGDTVYTGAFVNNLNAPETRARDLMDEALIDGFFGNYCKRVGGGVVVNVNANAIFEPASAAKINHHLTAWLDIQNGNNGTSLNTPVPYQGGDTTVDGGYDSCPQGQSDPFVNQPLSWILTRMMVNSDNEATFSVTNFYGGLANIQATSALVGMSDTLIRHHIGCPSSANSNDTTLVDFGRIYEAIVTGLISDTNRETMFSQMGGSLNAIHLGIIDEEAADIGLPYFQREMFKNQIQVAGKGGNYGYGNGLADRAGFGWISLPAKTGCVVTPREYVYGSFYNKISNEPSTGTGSRLALSTANAEMMREQYRAAMTTWLGCLADFNGTGGVTVQDIFDFLAAWNVAGPGTDFNGDRIVSVQDIFDFLASWNSAQR